MADEKTVASPHPLGGKFPQRSDDKKPTPFRVAVVHEIDWGRLRERIQATPYIVKPKHVKHPNRSPESIERRRESARARTKKYYWDNREECLALQRAWEKAHPEKVKAKKKRFYDSHKNDPVWMENHLRMGRETKQRARFKKYVLTMSVMCIRFHVDLGGLQIAA